MPCHRKAAVPLPKTASSNAILLSHSSKTSGGSCFARAPHPQTPNAPEPNNSANLASAVDSTNAHGETTSVTLDYGSRVWETLDRLHEIIAMPRFSRVEIKCIGMTEIAFGDQIGENENLVTRPSTGVPAPARSVPSPHDHPPLAFPACSHPVMVMNGCSAVATISWPRAVRKRHTGFIPLRITAQHFALSQTQFSYHRRACYQGAPVRQ